MEIAIKPAIKEDAASILALQKLAYLSEAEIYNDFDILPLHEQVPDVERAFMNYAILKAVSSEGEIIGSVRAREEAGTVLIGKLMVHPDYRDRGLGSQLMVAIENHVPGDRYQLFTGAKSEKNLSFYKKLGYRIYKHDQLPGEATTFAFMEK